MSGAVNERRAQSTSEEEAKDDRRGSDPAINVSLREESSACYTRERIAYHHNGEVILASVLAFIMRTNVFIQTSFQLL